MSRLLMLVPLVAIAAACSEELTTPAKCPDLCPGASLVIRDTVIEAIEDRDSTYTGYISADNIPALLISSGLEAGEARAWATFPRRTDTVVIDQGSHPLNIDSAIIRFRVLGLDTSVHDTRLMVHRIIPVIDTLTSFQTLDDQLTPESLIGAIPVSDTGEVKLTLRGADEVARIAVTEEFDLRLGLGLRVEAPSPTGVRVSSLQFNAGPPTISVYGTIDIADTARRRQTLSATADTANYILAGTPPMPGQELIALGSRHGARAILRFPVPAALKDSAIILRATLELTPSEPLIGLRNDPATLEVRGVLADVGAKSPYLTGVGASVSLGVDVSTVQSADIREIVGTWFVPGSPPSSLVIGLNPEGGTFAMPTFFSTRSATGAPRLRITYALPSRPGHP
jgi:hypothetical protein